MAERDSQTTRAMRCLTCGYDMRGLAEHRCPECGRAFDPSDSRTFQSKPRSGWRYVEFSFLGLLAIALPFLFLPLGWWVLWIVLPTIGAAIAVAVFVDGIRFLLGRYQWTSFRFGVIIAFLISGMVLSTFLGLVYVAFSLSRMYQ